MNKINYKQQLKIIEGLCIAFENGNTRDVNRANAILKDIYKIAHLNGTCKNLHLDWHAKAIKIAKEFNLSGLTKIEGVK